MLFIEPGFYLKEKYGIRIENCYETVKCSVPSGNENFIGFAPLTLVPIQTSIIDKSMLDQDEIEWLNAYHYEVLQKVGEHLKKEGKQEEYAWLEKACQKI
uniref:Peptidase_M24_C domain-containing protein n=1 Tax=Caenorhabditis tropicalis TaxID=1561998 RepID=A0A1I7UIW7_9PELO